MEWNKKRPYPVLARTLAPLYRDPIVCKFRGTYNKAKWPPEDKHLTRLMAQCPRARQVPMKVCVCALLLFVGLTVPWRCMQAYEHEEASVNALGDVLGAFKRTVTLAASNFTSRQRLRSCR